MSILPSWWRKNFLTAELIVAVGMSAVLLIWCKYAHGEESLRLIVQGNRAQIYGTIGAIFGSLLGFVITALSVVLGFSSSERLKVLRSSRYYKQLWDVFTSAIRVLGLTTVVWLAALFFDRESHTRPLLLFVALSFTSLAILRLVRCVWVLERIVEVLTLKGEQDEQS